MAEERPSPPPTSRQARHPRAIQVQPADINKFRQKGHDGQVLYLKGVLDNTVNVHAWLGNRSLFGKLMFKTVGVAPFVDTYVRDDVLHHGHILCCGRALAENPEGGMTPAKLRDARLLLVGEIITPVKPTGMDLPTPEAQAAYIQSVDTLRTDTNITYICDATHDGFIQWGGTDEEWNENPLTLQTATRLMSYFVSCKTTQSVLSPVAMLTYAFVAMSKRGTVSDEFCTKIVEGIRQDVGVTITLTSEIIKLMWAYYGDVMDDLVADNLFAMWKDELPANTLRLRITLEQTLNAGLTTLTVTVRGLTDHPAFPWDKLVELSPYSAEMAALKHAIEVVGDNRYYGYKKDLGDAKGTLYKNLSYIAKELLIKVNGETALNRYAGFPRKPAQAPIVNAMIEAYINRLHLFGVDPDKNPIGTPSRSEVYVQICSLRNLHIALYQHTTTV